MLAKIPKGLIYLLAASILVKESNQKRDYFFNLAKCEAYTADPLRCEVNCTIESVGNLKTITGYVNNLEPADKFGAGGEILVRPLRSNGNYMTLFNQTFPDLCPYLGGKRLPGIAQLAFNGLTKFGRIPKCPVDTGLFYLKNFYLSPELFPPHAPEAEFKIKGTFSGIQNGVHKPCAKWYIVGTVEMIKNRFWKKPKKDQVEQGRSRYVF